MKEGIHPKYNPVVFVDANTGDEFISKSTLTSADTREINGMKHFVIPL